MEYCRDELAVCLGADNKIYACGGFGYNSKCQTMNDSNCLKTVERYDLMKDQWERIADLNVQRRALSAVAFPDGIYVVGGFDGENYLSSVEKYLYLSCCLLIFILI